MFQRDHIVRQIQQMTQALAEVLLLRGRRRYRDALAAIQQTGETYFGLPLKQAAALPYDALAAAVHPNGTLAPEPASVLAELLRQQGACYWETNADAEATACFQHSLHLYLDLFLHAPDFQSPDVIQRIGNLVTRLGLHDVPRPHLRRLFDYYQRLRRYADAENVLFVLAEEPEADLREAGRAFYRHLRALPKKDLAEGGLPYPEVHEGLRAFERLMDPAA